MNSMEGGIKKKQLFTPDSHLTQYGAENYFGHDFAYFDKRLNDLGFGIKTDTRFDEAQGVRFMKQYLFSKSNPSVPLYEVKIPAIDGNVNIAKLDEDFFNKLLDEKETFTLRQDEGNNKKIARYFYLDKEDNNKLKLGPKEEKKG